MNEQATEQNITKAADFPTLLSPRYAAKCIFAHPDNTISILTGAQASMLSERIEDLDITLSKTEITAQLHRWLEESHRAIKTEVERMSDAAQKRSDNFVAGSPEE